VLNTISIWRNPNPQIIINIVRVFEDAILFQTIRAMMKKRTEIKEFNGLLHPFVKRKEFSSALYLRSYLFINKRYDSHTLNVHINCLCNLNLGSRYAMSVVC
jgi:hypothetical protein